MELTNPERTLVELAKRMGLGVLAQSVEKAEVNGQTMLVRSTAVPTERRGPDAAYEALGFKFGAVVEDDPMFQNVELPDGWRKVATDHRLWSDIVDERGRKRASVFYKAAFYDRRAFARLRPRFVIEVNFARKDQDVAREWCVFDDGKPIYSVVFLPLADFAEDGHDRMIARDDALQGQCEAWLSERVPRWEDPDWQISPECWAFALP